METVWWGPCYFYVCFFVNNQFRILLEQTAAGSDNLEAVFEDNLKRIGKMVAILDTWERPVYLTRIWTVFEQFVASTIQIEARNSQRQIGTISLCWPHRSLMFSGHAQVIRFPVEAPNGFVSKYCTPKVKWFIIIHHRFSINTAIFGYPPFLDRSKFPCFSRSKVQFVMPKATAKQLQGEIASGSEGIDRVIDALSQVRVQQLTDGTLDLS